MPIATLTSEVSGEARRFVLDLCPVHVFYAGALYARQGGDWDRDSTYRRTHLHMIDDTMRLDPVALDGQPPDD